MTTQLDNFSTGFMLFEHLTFCYYSDPTGDNMGSEGLGYTPLLVSQPLVCAWNLYQGYPLCNDDNQ